jgi:hypothetical protein
MDSEITTITFQIGDRIILRRDGKIGEITEIRDSELFRNSVQFVDDDPDTLLSDAEILLATDAGIALALAPKEETVEETANTDSALSADEEAQLICERIDKGIEGIARDHLARTLIQAHETIEKSLNTLETKDTQSRAIIENLVTNLRKISFSEDGFENEALPEFPKFTGSLAEMADALCPDRCLMSRSAERVQVHGPCHTLWSMPERSRYIRK